MNSDFLIKMDFFEIAEIFFLFVEFCDLNSCLRLLRVNREFRERLGTSKIWEKFFNPKFAVNQKFTYRRLCHKLEGNQLFPNNIRIRQYYAESYYRMVYQKFRFNDLINLKNFYLANESDLKKTRFLFKDYRFRHPLAITNKDRLLMEKLFNCRKELNKIMANIPSVILKYIYISLTTGYRIYQIYLPCPDEQGLRMIDELTWINDDGKIFNCYFWDLRIPEIAQLSLEEIEEKLTLLRDYYQSWLLYLPPYMKFSEFFRALVSILKFSIEYKR